MRIESVFGIVIYFALVLYVFWYQFKGAALWLWEVYTASFEPPAGLTEEEQLNWWKGMQ